MDLIKAETGVSQDHSDQGDHQTSPPEKRIMVIGNMTPDLHPAIIRGEIDMLTVETPPEAPKLEVPEMLSKKAIKLKMAEMVREADLQNVNEGLVMDPEHKALKARKKKHSHKRSISSNDRRIIKANGGAWWLKGNK